MEDVFDLRGFVVTILRRWRMIFVCGLLFAVLLGGYRLLDAVGQMRAVQADLHQQELYIIEQERYEEQKSLAQLEIQRTIDETVALESYIEKVALRINPYQGSIATANFLISAPFAGADELAYSLYENEMSKLRSYYQTVSQDCNLYRHIADQLQLDLSPEYLRELVLVEVSDGFVITITVADNDQAMAEKMRDAAAQYLQQNQLGLAGTLKRHELESIGQSSGKATATSAPLLTQLQEKRIGAFARVTALNKQLAEYKTTLATLARPQAPASVAGNLLGVIKKTALVILIGFVGGAGLGVLLSFFVDVMDVRVKNARDVSQRLKLTCLCELKGKGGKL